MIETWYTILAFMLTMFVVLDGRNFGAGAVQHLVARNPQERKQVIAAIGPLWSWHEVWLVSAGGTLFVAFPRLLATSFSGYYLALFLVLWMILLRGISLEVRSHLDNPLWQTFWDFIFPVASIVLAVLFGAAFGNLLRGVPLGADGSFQMAFFTDFGVRGNVGILDWYTVSAGVFSLVLLSAHGATYLTVKTEGDVHDRSARLSRWLWPIAMLGLGLITLETRYVCPWFFPEILHRPLAWLGVAVALIGTVLIFTSRDAQRESRRFVGSNLLIVGLLGTAAAALFPIMLPSTLGSQYTLTAYNSASARESLLIAALWWPFALLFAFVYFFFIRRHYLGKVKVSHDTNRPY